MKKENEKIETALIKKAVGYLSKEIVEEFSGEGDDLKLIKRKVTYKDVPPDVSAIKVILDGETDVSSMSDEELKNEKIRLLKLIKEQSIGEEIEKED